MLTIRAEVLKDKKRNDGTYNVKVRFIKDKKVKRISTDLFATDADLTADLRLKEDSVIKQEADRLILFLSTNNVTILHTFYIFVDAKILTFSQIWLENVLFLEFLVRKSKISCHIMVES